MRPRVACRDTAAGAARLAAPGSRAARGMVLVAALAGCASAPPREVRVREAIAEGRYREAAEAARAERDEVLRHLDRALALFHARDPAASNLLFGRAEAVAEERYTRSLGRAAASLFVNDRLLPYQLEPWERLLIPLYRALNYVVEGQPEDVAVEARRLSSLLLERRDRHPARAAGEGDAFLYVVAGALFEWAARAEDAAVAYRNARVAYPAGAALPPAWLPAEAPREPSGTDAASDSLAREGSSAGGGVAEDGRVAVPPATRAAAYGPPAPREGAGPASVPGVPEGEVIVLLETGFVAAPMEETFLLFLEADDARRAREEPDLLGEEVAKRILARRGPGAGGGQDHEDDDHEGGLGYLFPVALRVRPLPPIPPAPMSLEVDGGRFELPVAFDLSRAAALAYEDELPALLAKTAARAAVKALVLKEATDDEGSLVRILANLLHVATERADTRAWLSLPGELRFARLRLRPGTHDLRVRVAGPAGERTLDLPGVVVEVGRATLVTARVGEPTWPASSGAIDTPRGGL